MIINLKKILFFGLEKEVNRFFKKAQNQGFIEFISNKAKKTPSSEIVSKLYLALKILKKQPVVVPSVEKVSVEKTVDMIIEKDREISHLRKQIHDMKKEVALICPLGDFSVEDISYLEKEANLYVQFFCQKTKKQRVEDEKLIYISTEYDLDYFVSIQKEKISPESFVEIKVERSLRDLKQDLEKTKKQLQEADEKLRSLAKFFPNVQRELNEHLNTHNLSEAIEGVNYPTNQPLFAIEAWVPDNKFEQLNRLLEAFDVSYEEIKIEKHDRVPTCFENKGFSRVGEDLVCVYDVPDNTDKDPSFWVLFSFAIFFAVIVSDAGYGLIYLAIFLYLQFKVKNKKASVKRFTKLTGLLAFTSITWGVFTASFFGLDISPNNSFRKYSVIQILANKKAEYHLTEKDDVYQEWLSKYPKVSSAKTPQEFFAATTKKDGGSESFEALDRFYDNILMEVALLFGVIHLTIAFLWYLGRSWPGIGWVAFMIGGYFFFPSILNATSMLHFLGIIAKQTAFSIGPYLLYGGLIAAIVLAIMQRGLWGITEGINAIQVFADVLSYLRLYALGLAGMIMGSTFNMLASEAPLILGIFIVIAGHATNIVLGLMGGVIHGLRLNFLEWYHWCYEGEGKLFNPLRKI